MPDAPEKPIDPIDILGRFASAESLQRRWFAATYVLVEGPSTAQLVQAIAEESPKAEIERYEQLYSAHLPASPKRPYSPARPIREYPAGQVFVAASKQPNVSVCMSMESAEFVDNQLLRLLRQLRGQIALGFLSSGDLESVLGVLVKRIEPASLLAERSLFYSRKRHATISYDRRAPDEVFEAAKRGEGFVASIRVSATDEKRKPLLSCTLARDCTFKYHAGNVRLFTEAVLRPAIDRFASRLGLFKGRGTHRFGEEVRPLSITYTKAQFRGRKDNESLVGLVADRPDWMVTVHHLNPYLHMTVTHHRDGSVIDLFVTSPTTVTLVPSLRASTSAIGELADTIFQSVDEGDIGETSACRYSMADLADGVP